MKKVLNIPLLREGLDIPEVSLVAILDADKEGFLRSADSLIQTMGRAARNVRGKVLLYADVMTRSLRQAIDETDRRRSKQAVYNEDHGITPETVKKEQDEVLWAVAEGDYLRVGSETAPEDGWTADEIAAEIERVEIEMKAAAEDLKFEKAAELRDRARFLKELLLNAG